MKYLNYLKPFIQSVKFSSNAEEQFYDRIMNCLINMGSSFKVEIVLFTLSYPKYTSINEYCIVLYFKYIVSVVIPFSIIYLRIKFILFRKTKTIDQLTSNADIF